MLGWPDVSLRVIDAPETQAQFNRAPLVTSLYRVSLETSLEARLVIQTNPFAMFVNGWVLPKD